MATRPMKQISGLPGLEDNTYTFVQLDDTLTTAGKAADAKTTGDQIGSLYTDFDTRVNALHGLVNYGYDTPGSSVTEDRTITRNGTQVVINGTIASGSTTLKIRLNGLMNVTSSSTAPSEYDNTIRLTVGHTYLWRVQKISGTCTDNAEDASARVPRYALARVYNGKSFNTYGSSTDNGNESSVRFTYSETDTPNGINLAMVLLRSNGGINAVNATYVCTLEDVTDGGNYEERISALEDAVAELAEIVGG